MKLLSDCGRSARSYLRRSRSQTPHFMKNSQSRYLSSFRTVAIFAKLTLQNYFYSILHSFLNLEIANNFIPEEDYKLRAAMYDVEPCAPR